MLHFEAYRKRWIIAKGTPAVRGEDGWYELMFDKDIKEQEPKIRDDGTVDYSPNIQMVHAGDKVMVYHPPIPGKMGVTIFGSTIAPIRAKEAKPYPLTHIERRGNDFFATENGRIRLRSGRLEVMSCLVMNGDAGYATGMIDFIGDVFVRGDVKDGVVMNIGGNLEVGGVIDAAQIKVAGNLVCHGGIHGKQKALIEVGGSLTANFIEEATINVKKEIMAGHIINAEIKSEDKVVVEGVNGIIIGGNVQAEECISAVAVGNDKGFKTNLRIASTDVWSREYARIMISWRTYPNTYVDINGMVNEDCRIENKELHVTRKGIEAFEMGTYEYHDVLAELESQSDAQAALEEAKSAPKQESKEEAAVVQEVKKLVLIVDDDPVFLKTQYAYLISDYNVAVVSSGEDALKYLKTNKPDVILLDYLMPNMNGSELLQQIRGLPSDEADIPVFFLTSVTDKNVIVKCLSLYPQKYLIKPMEKTELLQILSEFFNGEHK